MLNTASRRALAWALTAAALGLSGCATAVDALGGAQDTRVLNADTVQGERQSSLGETVTGKKGGHGTPSDRATRRLRGDAGCVPISTDGLSTSGQAENFSFFCKQSGAEKDVTDAEKAKLYLAAGLTLSNELCEAWFSQLYVTQTTLRQSSDSISNFGSLTAAILGFTQTPSEVIGLTASVFGSAKQATDTLSTNYIVAADLTTVASAVREYRALYARDIDQAQSKWNYYTARRVIMSYDNTCSALYVRKFVNARVAGSKGDQAEPLIEAAINAFASDGAKYFSKEVTPGQLIDIYALAILKETPQPVREELRKGLAADQLADAQGLKLKVGVSVSDVANAIFRANIDTALKTRATARVEMIREQLATAAGAKKAAAEKQKEALTTAAGVTATAVAAETAARTEATKADNALKLANSLEIAAKARLDQTVIDVVNRNADVAKAAELRGRAEGLVTVQAAEATEQAKAALAAANTGLIDTKAAQVTAEAARVLADADYRKALTNRAGAETDNTEAKRELAEAEARTAAAKSAEGIARADSNAASSDSASAKAAADGAARSASDALNPLNAITPLGPTGRPLDSPPTP